MTHGGPTTRTAGTETLIHFGRSIGQAKAVRLLQNSRREFFRNLFSRALKRNKTRIYRWLAFAFSHPSSKRRSMDGAQFHFPWVGFVDGGLIQDHIPPSLWAAISR
jgi:hypothetical protein